MKIQDYYDIIGVTRGASTEEIRGAYRSLVLRWHPDRHDGHAKRVAEERFKEISEAYEVLSDPARRRRYDAFFAEEEKVAFPRARHALDDLDGGGDAFSALFEGAPRSQMPRSQMPRSPVPRSQAPRSQVPRSQVPRSQVPGPQAIETLPDGPPIREVHAVCALTVSQVVAGGMARVSVPDLVTCAACAEGHETHDSVVTCSTCGGEVNGAMKVVEFAVPDGAYDGQLVRIDGVGPKVGRARADLLVTLRIVSDECFRREGVDVHAQVAVAPWEAALGAKVAVRSPAGDLLVSVPPRTHNGTRLRLAGKGLGDGGGRRGDFYLTVQMDLPDRLSDRHRELLRALKDGPGPGVFGGVRIADR